MKTVLPQCSLLGNMEFLGRKVKIYISMDGYRYRQALPNDQNVIKAVADQKIVSLVQLWSPAPAPLSPAGGTRARIKQENTAALAA